MSSPETTTQKILHPPTPNLPDDKTGFYQLMLELWNRSGGYEPAVTNLNGLKASVAELNELVGINTDETVQTQINKKPNTSTLGTMAYENSNAVSITGGNISATSISGSSESNGNYSNATILSGTITGSGVTILTGSSLTASLSGTLFSNYGTAANALAAETILLTQTLLANTLSANGQYIEIIAFGKLAANANSKEIKLKIGATTILDTGAVLANAGSWQIKSTIVRVAAASLKCSSTILSSNALVLPSSTYVLAVENTAVDLNVFCTGTGVANNDIVQEGLIIKFYN